MNSVECGNSDALGLPATVKCALDVLRMAQTVILVRDLLILATQARIGRPRKSEERSRIRPFPSNNELERPSKAQCCNPISENLDSGASPSLQSMTMKNPTHPAPSMDFQTDLSRNQGTISAPSSLSDLSLAVFLESLYTLEIAPSDGLTPNMLSLPGQQNTHEPNNMNTLTTNSDPSAGVAYADSALLGNSLVYSVPSDLQWWNLAWSFPGQNESATTPNVDSKNGGTTALEPAHKAKEPIDVQSSAAMHAPVESNQASHCCASKVKQESHAPSSPAHATHEKVHCVPNPTGPGCSCLCESDVALLSLQRSLRHGPLAVDEPRAGEQMREDAASSLVFTLSMSQAITKKCACSADCPTCKKDPSYEVSAGLLISTALQIYARALKVFQEVLVSDGSSKCVCSDYGTCKNCHCSASVRKSQRGLTGEDNSIEVRIGDFIPTSQNARKIALYAMKLELLDLERALAHVQDVSQQSLVNLEALPETPRDINTGSCCASKVPDNQHLKRSTPLRMNPIDQLIIRKLHVQLSEVLQTVENLEANEKRPVP